MITLPLWVGQPAWAPWLPSGVCGEEASPGHRDLLSALTVGRGREPARSSKRPRQSLRGELGSAWGLVGVELTRSPVRGQQEKTPWSGQDACFPRGKEASASPLGPRQSALLPPPLLLFLSALLGAHVLPPCVLLLSPTPFLE